MPEVNHYRIGVQHGWRYCTIDVNCLADEKHGAMFMVEETHASGTPEMVLRDKVPGIDLPVLLLHESEDRIIPSTASEWLHAHLPDSALTIIGNDGHALAAHSFGKVMKAMDHFLAG